MVTFLSSVPVSAATNSFGEEPSEVLRHHDLADRGDAALTRRLAVGGGDPAADAVLEGGQLDLLGEARRGRFTGDPVVVHENRHLAFPFPILPPEGGTAPSSGGPFYSSVDVVAERPVVVQRNLHLKDFMPLREAREDARRQFRQHRAAEDVVDVARAGGRLPCSARRSRRSRRRPPAAARCRLPSALADAAQLEPDDLLQDLVGSG